MGRNNQRLLTGFARPKKGIHVNILVELQVFVNY